MRNLIIISSILLLFACKSTYEDTLKSRDVEQKEKLAFELYENQDYYKASDLFKSLIQDKKTGLGIEKMFFYYAMCDYKMGDFGLGLRLLLPFSLISNAISVAIRTLVVFKLML